MKIKEFLLDPGSSTEHFSKLACDYAIEVLKSAESDGYFERVVAIYLGKVPCMVAISRTLTADLIFLDILQNAGKIPIGRKLFAVDSGITRTNLDVETIAKSAIKDITVTNFIERIELSVAELYIRTSDFIYQDQKMHLDEYILPGLQLILTNYE